ncbi:hypothetical protein NEOLEDRAFT_1022719, partial [Neolentinus lepideus HHB14362 ss-1]
VPARWKLTGARLQGLTLKQIYKHILKRKMKIPTIGTVIPTRERIKSIQQEFKSLMGYAPTEQQIWRANRKHPIRHRITEFLWMLLHNKLRIGVFFAHIPDWEQRQMCHHCGEIETASHLLLECTNPLIKTIWGYIKTLWERMYPMHNWVEPTINII